MLLTNCQIDKQKLEESQAKAYAASVDQAQKLQQVQKQSQDTILQLTNKVQQAEVKLLQFDKMSQENIRLKQEMQRVFQITSAHSVVDLAEQIQQLKL